MRCAPRHAPPAAQAHVGNRGGSCALAAAEVISFRCYRPRSGEMHPAIVEVRAAAAERWPASRGSAAGAQIFLKDHHLHLPVDPRALDVHQSNKQFYVRVAAAVRGGV